MTEKAAKKRTVKQSLLRSALIKNPVLFEVVGLSPLVAMTASLKSAIILTVASCAELIFIEIFAGLALKKVKRWLRMPIYAVLGVLLNIPIFAFFNYFTPNEAGNVGIFLPLIAVNSLVALHCERFAVKHSIKHTFLDAVFASVGYACVILLVGTVREIFASGTLYGYDLHLPVKLSGLALPFGAFLVLGFLAAAVQAVLRKTVPNAHPQAAFSMQEISQSHLDSFKALVDTDFNPYVDDPTVEDETETEKPNRKKPTDTAAEGGRQKPKKPKKEKVKTERPAKPEKAEKPKKERKSKKAKAQKAIPAPPAEAELQDTAERTQRRTERDSYLLDFDEMLSDLDAYRQKQKDTNAPKDAAKPKENGEKGGENL